MAVSIELVDRLTGYRKTPNIFYQTKTVIEPLIVSVAENKWYAFYKYDGSCIRLIYSRDGFWVRGRSFKSLLDERYKIGIRHNYSDAMDTLYERLGGDGWIVIYGEAYGGKYLSSDFYNLDMPTQRKIKFSSVDEYYGDVPGAKLFAIRKLVFDDDGKVVDDYWLLGISAWKLFMEIIDDLPHGLVDIADYVGKTTIEGAVDTVRDFTSLKKYVVEGLVLWSRETEAPIHSYKHEVYVGRKEDVINKAKKAHFELPNVKVKAKDIARYLAHHKELPESWVI